MTTTWYWAQIAKHAGEYWVYPADFLGVNVADANLDEALRIAVEITAEHAADLIEAGQPIPEPTAAENLRAIANEWGRRLIAVELPS
jgi:predicted RNase H-like HicB family nuclease